MNRPELHDVLRRWRASRRRRPRRILVGETYVLDLDQLIPFYGTGEDELHLAFNFLFVHADLDAAQMRPLVEGIEAQAAGGGVAGVDRLQPRRRPARDALGGRRPERARAALLMLLTLRGTPFLYYGDEIALPDVALDPADGARPGRAAHRRPRAQPRPLPHADAVDARSPAPASPSRARAVAAVHRHDRNVGDQRDDPARRFTSCAT